MIETGERIVHWVAERTEARAGFGVAQGIGWVRDGEILAGVVYCNFNGANIDMHVAAVPGRRWLTREYLWFCFFYPFYQCGVKRITGLVPASNEDARKFDEHLGFTLEARLKDAHPTGDILVYRMFKNDCRWLNRHIPEHLKRRAA